ncbi:MAG: hypothetical protein WB711_25130, partial [Terriglobales bacterium]
MWQWTQMLVSHPKAAIALLWNGFWGAWTPILTAATIFIAFIFDPPLLGYGATKVLFVLAMAMIFIRCCYAEELHGKKETRKEWPTRLWVDTISLIVLSSISFLMCGVLENAKRGEGASLANIWKASLRWHASDTANPSGAPIAASLPIAPPPQAGDGQKELAKQLAQNLKEQEAI